MTGARSTSFRIGLAAAALLLTVQVAAAQRCATEKSAAQEAQCPDDAFMPKSCRTVLMEASTELRAFTAAWMATVAYDVKDGRSWESAARSQLAKWRFSDIRFGAQGGIEFFVANAPDNVYVIFRGSDSNIDWKTNLQTEFVAVTGLGRVHKGFWEAFKQVHAAFKDYVSDFRAGRKGVVYAGHSLGAAIATLAAASRQYGAPGSVSNVFTFGSPKVGDAAWAGSYSDLGLWSLTYRIVNDLDPVPMVPPGGSVGYRHVGTQWRLTSAYSDGCRVTAPSYCPSGSNPAVADGLLGGLADQACAGNGFAIGVANIGASLFGVSFSASDLLREEPRVCCADFREHDMKVYRQRLQGGCLSACDQLVDCSCQQDEPQLQSDAAPAPAGDLMPGDVAPAPAGELMPGDVQGFSADELQPVQDPEPAPEPPRNPDTAVYRIVVQTSCAAWAGTNAYLEVLVSDDDGRKYRSGQLDNPGNDLERCRKDTYDVGTGPWVHLSTASMQVYFRSTVLFAGGWTPAWIQVVQNPSDSVRASVSFCYGASLGSTGWYTFSRCQA